MEPEVLFKICNTMVLPGWVLLIFAPHWKWTKWLINTYLIPLLLSVIYLYLIITTISSAEGSFNSLAGVAKLFTNKELLLAGWVHYLAFDLFIGGWEVLDSQKNNLSHGFVIPCLILTFLFGPIGLLLYIIFRQSFRSTKP